VQRNHAEALLSVEEVARRLDVHEVTVYRWCRSGRLRCSKPGKSWWVRESDLAVLLEQSHRPGTLTEHLDKFFAVPDHVFAVVEDGRLLSELHAGFFRVAEARGGVLVKVFDPRTITQHALATALNDHGVPVKQLEAQGRLYWRPATGLDAAVAVLEQLVTDEALSEQTTWAIVNWTGVGDPDTEMWQQIRLAALIAAHPRLIVFTGVVEPEPATWPSVSQQWKLLANLRGFIRYARAGLLLSRIVVPTPG
jgi:excisionase family DNA binding protein